MQNKHVFMVVQQLRVRPSSRTSGRSRAAFRLLGAGYDGTYYGEPGNENIISAFGNAAPVNGASYDPHTEDREGAGRHEDGVARLRHLAVVEFGGGEVERQVRGARGRASKAVYTNTTIDFGSTDVGPLVLGIKNSGADSAFYAMNGNTNLAIAQGLKQNGVNMKAELMATGYGQALLDEPSSAQIGPEVIFTQGWAPVEAKTKATKQFQADLKKYADSTGVPDFGIYTGYTDCDLIITGLKQQGKNLDQSTFSDDLRKLGQVNPAGLNCQPIDISVASYGKQPPTICSYAMHAQERQVRHPQAQGRRQAVLDRRSWSASRSRRPPPPPPRPRRSRLHARSARWLPPPFRRRQPARGRRPLLAGSVIIRSWPVSMSQRRPAARASSISCSITGGRSWTCRRCGTAGSPRARLRWSGASFCSKHFHGMAT